ncbi:hypothetical protein [Acidithiobacillus acidisediminis]|uniref:hypothetical protein n=1 Tax=Acidithiobacillus TaxID=119977 RepID=UPI00200F72CB|nr:hypothetical protein [Acidithiobacillus sp. S30A2]
MVHVTLQNDTVLFEVMGLHKLWSLKSRLEIPLSEIISVHKYSAAAHDSKGWRVAGTYIPDLITAGTYYCDGKRSFWDSCNGDNAIFVTLTNNRYNQLIVEVEDPDVVIHSLDG